MNSNGTLLVLNPARVEPFDDLVRPGELLGLLDLQGSSAEGRPVVGGGSLSLLSAASERVGCVTVGYRMSNRTTLSLAC